MVTVSLGWKKCQYMESFFFCAVVFLYVPYSLSKLLKNTFLCVSCVTVLCVSDINTMKHDKYN